MVSNILAIRQPQPRNRLKKYRILVSFIIISISLIIYFFTHLWRMDNIKHYRWPQRSSCWRHPILGRNTEIRKYKLTLLNALKQRRQKFTRYRDHIYGVVILVSWEFNITYTAHVWGHEAILLIIKCRCGNNYLPTFGFVTLSNHFLWR